MRFFIFTITLLVALYCNAQDYNKVFNTEFKEAMTLYSNGNYQASFAKMKNIAMQGFPLAQIELARDYDSGAGCTVDFNAAYSWMYKAANNTTWNKVPQGVQDFQGVAFFYLGIYSMEGMGTQKNMNNAVNYWQKGCRYASPYQANCFLQLAFGYQRGWGNLTKDLAKAREMFKKASDLGDPDAPYHLAEFYAQGIGGVSQSEPNAFYYIKLSAERGYADGQCLLGEIYENGYCGQQKNVTLAKEWFKKAARQGQSDAIGYLTELGETW